MALLIKIGQHKKLKVYKEIKVYMRIWYITKVAFQISGEEMGGNGNKLV